MSRPSEARASRDVCAVIVTYQPDAQLRENAVAIAAQVDAVRIVDNGSTGAALDTVREAAAAAGASLLLNGENLGIATALNQGVAWALEHGFAWVLTMDQDSRCAPAMVETLRAAHRTSAAPDRVAMVGARYDGAAERDAGAAHASAAAQPPAEPVRAVITSGTLLSAAAYRRLGPFDDRLFIDWVDIEYCLRARRHGYVVLQSRAPLMEHAIGRVTEHRIGSRTTTTTNHSVLRRYYRHRNFVLVVRRHGWHDLRWALGATLDVTKGLLLIGLFERERRAKLAAAVRGLVDGAFGRTAPAAARAGGRP